MLLFVKLKFSQVNFVILSKFIKHKYYMSIFTIYSPSNLILTYKQNAVAEDTTPVVAKVETQASAPTGTTYFLAVDMKSPDAGQDYISTTADEILRGVIMFPSGVIPGLVRTDSSYGEVVSAVMPTAAWGTYSQGQSSDPVKDCGSDIGKLYSDNTFKLVLNGFSNTSNYNAHLTGSFDPLSPIYFPKVLNTDPKKFQREKHLLYLDLPVENSVAAPIVTGHAIGLLNGHESNTGLTGAGVGGVYRDLFGRFDTRYQAPRTTKFISQPFGKTEYDLFPPK